MMKKLILIALGAVVLNTANAQDGRAKLHRTCGTHEYNEQLMQNDPAFAAEQARINSEAAKADEALQNGNANAKVTNLVTIPVVVHVIWKTTAQNIADAKIFAQLEQTNLDFAALNSDTGSIPAVFKPLLANTQVQFCLAQRDPQGNPTTGIIRKQTTVTSFSQGSAMKYDAQGGSNAWPAGQYLNLWVCNLGQGLLGFAQFPGGSAATDGVVCLYSTVGGMSNPGSLSPYNLGRTNSHEIGHWLNLRHIWGDANCGSDLVSDTPTQQTSNFSCPSWPHVTSCTGNAPNGDMFMNYMDYTDDDCMHMFTPGQATRMNSCLNTSRVSLKTSLGCVPVGIDEIADASAIMNVFPNPSNGMINLQFLATMNKAFEINVYNTVGQRVFNAKESKHFDTNYAMDLSALNKGVYNLILTVEGKSYSTRITIQD